jgi:hypothetical protein
MLAGVLRSEKAIEMNLRIVRAFVALRHFALNYAELSQKLNEFMVDTKMEFNEIYQALSELSEQKKLGEKPRNPIGYI